jgi:hypothetical protein
MTTTTVPSETPVVAPERGASAQVKTSQVRRYCATQSNTLRLEFK